MTAAALSDGETTTQLWRDNKNLMDSELFKTTRCLSETRASVLLVCLAVLSLPPQGTQCRRAHMMHQVTLHIVQPLERSVVCKLALGVVRYLTLE